MYRQFAAIALLVSLAAPAAAATIDTYEFLLGGPDSLTFIIDSIASSTFSNRFSRYRISTGTMSKMASDVQPNTNLVAIGNTIWFTTREAPFRIGRADLSTVTGTPVYYAPAATTAAFDDMTLGPDGSLWATSATDRRVVRVTQSGVITTFTGNGAIHPLGITAGSDGNIWFADGVNRRITRIDTATGAFTDLPVPQLSGATIPERITSTAGSGLVWFATRDGFGSVNPATGAIQVVATESQQPLRMKAGTDGTLWLTTGTQFVTQFTPPANYAKLKVFDEPLSEAAGLYIGDDGVVYVSDRWDWKLARIATANDTPADTTVTEFYNGLLDHYFATANAAEALAIDTGSAGPGWTRTGQMWRAWVGGPIPNAAEVCRFYGTAEVNPATGLRRGPNSHFYTLQPGECAAVKLDPGWIYESSGKYWMVKPESAGGAGCPAATRAVYRAYNHRFAANDSNHRYMVSPTLYDQMLAQGWSGEGVVMCAPL